MSHNVNVLGDRQPPIPTYEEALLGSRASDSDHAPEDDGDSPAVLPHSRQSLRATRNGYRQPTVESARASIDSDLSMPELAADEDFLRRELHEMAIDDSLTASVPSRLRRDLSLRMSKFAKTMAALGIPTSTDHILAFIKSVYTRFPVMPSGFTFSLPILARLLGLLIIGLLLYALLALEVIPSRDYLYTHFDPESVRARALAQVDIARIADNLRYISSYDHLAGTQGDLYLANWMYEFWRGANIDKAAMADYYVYLNYPTLDGRSLTLYDKGDNIAWTAKLEEQGIPSGSLDVKQQTFAFHGHSRSSDPVKGPLIYANTGSREDFRHLADLEIPVKGSVILLRASDRLDLAVQLRHAELAGALGCLIYTDSQNTDRLQAKDIVHRGSVSQSRWVLGDVLTPGYASNVDMPRLSTSNNSGLVNIPSLPISTENAKYLLDSIRDAGKPVPDKAWEGTIPGLDSWWTGGKDSPNVGMRNNQDESKLQTIWNVYGLLKGIEDPQSKIIVGNHRDAWCFGAVNPGSGTAVLMEVVTIFGILRQVGWRPLRTVEFVSWDAGAYNAIGLTEYIEDHIDVLRDNAVAYLNVDAGVYGQTFDASGSPMFQRVLEQVLERVDSPSTDEPLLEQWTKAHPLLPPIGADPNHVAFQSLTGASSMNFGFHGAWNSFPAQSCYDTFEWMEKHVDFTSHSTLARIWVLLIIELADRPILPFDLGAYASALDSHVQILETAVKALFPASQLVMDDMYTATTLLTQNAAKMQGFDDFWSAEVMGVAGYEDKSMRRLRKQHNRRLASFETDLLDLPDMFDGEREQEHGVSQMQDSWCETSRLTCSFQVPGRTQYKHMVFGPTAEPGENDTVFPAIRDAMDRGDLNATQIQINKAARIIQRAAMRLLGDSA